jgi:oligopeptide transport system ATP-binding protein
VPDPLVEEKRQRIILTGDVPSPANPPTGCNFNTRCPVSFGLCYEAPDPELVEVTPGHFVSCHRVDKLS